MKHFTGVKDASHVEALLKQALHLKQDPLKHHFLGKNKTLGLIFLNPSLRTRMSTQKAAANLGMNVTIINASQDSWSWEFEDGAVMNSTKTEHIKDAAAVIGSYCDYVGIRCFPSLTSREDDYSEKVLGQFINHGGVPIISLESATRHPLQSLADLITIRENWQLPRKPKVVLSWAPHVKPLPQAVANSFSEWMCYADVDFTIAHPPGYELDKTFTEGANITHKQEEAIADADFIYVKNWSSYHDYGRILPVENNWMLTEEKLAASPAKIMHCLPVRRNVELGDNLLDGSRSLVLQQAQNRVYAAQTVLKKLLDQDLTFKNQALNERQTIHY